MTFWLPVESRYRNTSPIPTSLHILSPRLWVDRPPCFVQILYLFNARACGARRKDYGNGSVMICACIRCARWRNTMLPQRSCGVEHATSYGNLSAIRCAEVLFRAVVDKTHALLHSRVLRPEAR